MAAEREHQAKLKGLMRKLGYQFVDVSWLELALRHRSLGAKNNERLEFLGDSLVNFFVADLLFNKFEKLSEGDLSRLRASLVKGETLAEIGREYNLSDYLILGAGELKSGGFRRDSIIADAVEAIIAAIYQDGGLAPCRDFVNKAFAKRLASLDPKQVGKDPKTLLQEMLQAEQQPLPEYSIISVNGAAHAQQFTVACYVAKLNTKFEATDTSRRKAEQAAAEAAIQAIKEANQHD